MENIVAYKNKSPKIDSSAYINPFALIIGDVTISEGVTVWPGAIIRADDDRIEIGNDTAVLDRVLIEAPRDNPVTIGHAVLVSHGAILHGCYVQSGALIGIGANILDGAEIGSESVIGAGALITPNTTIPPRSKVMGSPGKVVGEVSDEDAENIKSEHTRIMEKARDYGRWFVTNQF
jgi:carbonic anhydrase/acetyltransferase-like protein (isoleucine patch superfamily)